MSNYSLVFPTITTSNCTAGTNCTIGAICTATSQCSTGGCCGYFLNPVMNKTVFLQYAGSYGLVGTIMNKTVFLQYAGSYGLVGTKITTASNYAYNALIGAYY